MMVNLSNNYDSWRKQVACNLKTINEKIEKAAREAGKKKDDVILLAATKTVPAEIIEFAVAQGVKFVGENRVQEFEEKYEIVKNSGAVQHFIGHLQTNKVKKIVGKVSLIQSVGSVHLAKEIDRCSKKLGIASDILIEVNIGNEESKAGVRASEIHTVMSEISKFSNVKVLGLMAIPPLTEKRADTAKFFSLMRQLFIDIDTKKMDNINMKYLSMGMSGDYELAILTGANIVRIGSALFGDRPPVNT